MDEGLKECVFKMVIDHDELSTLEQGCILI